MRWYRLAIAEISSSAPYTNPIPQIHDMHMPKCAPPLSESSATVTNHIILKFIRPVFISIYPGSRSTVTLTRVKQAKCQSVTQAPDQTRVPGTVRWQCLSVGQVCSSYTIHDIIINIWVPGQSWALIFIACV